MKLLRNVLCSILVAACSASASPIIPSEQTNPNGDNPDDDTSIRVDASADATTTDASKKKDACNVTGDDACDPSLMYPDEDCGNCGKRARTCGFDCRFEVGAACNEPTIN